MGVFSCICSIIRLYSIRVFTRSSDPFYDAAPINIWSIVELNVGLICASIPALKTLFGNTFRSGNSQSDRTKSTRGYVNQTNGPFSSHIDAQYNDGLYKLSKLSSTVKPQNSRSSLGDLQNKSERSIGIEDAGSEAKINV